MATDAEDSNDSKMMRHIIFLLLKMWKDKWEEKKFVAVSDILAQRAIFSDDRSRLRIRAYGFRREQIFRNLFREGGAKLFSANGYLLQVGSNPEPLGH